MGLALEINTSLSTRQGIVTAVLEVDSRDTNGVFRELEGSRSWSSKGGSGSRLLTPFAPASFAEESKAS